MTGSRAWLARSRARHVLQCLLSALFVLCAAMPFAAPASNAAPMPRPPLVEGTAFVLMDADTGTLVAQSGADVRHPPASLTKIMTAYIVEGEIDSGRVGVDDQVPISVNAWRMGGSEMFIREGTQVRLKDLLRGVIIVSGNDASVALAEYLAGSEDAFVDMMNATAKRLGMRNTHYLNATGLPAPGHFSTARDLATLASHVVDDYPDLYRIYSEKEFVYNNIAQRNRNDLLFTDRTVDGMKTGWTDEAGYCLIASSKRDGMRLVAVILGAPSPAARVRDAAKLLSYGFRYYQTHRLYTAQQVVKSTPVWSGAADELELVVPNAVNVTLQRGRYNDLVAEAEVQHIVQAPIAAGARLGVMRLKLDGRVLQEVPLVAKVAVEEGGFLKRAWHAVYLFFSELFS
jgi:D-alanyl-D-alanine carboxypeptidase (penicillin-binding protein 5/6)